MRARLHATNSRERMEGTILSVYFIYLFSDKSKRRLSKGADVTVCEKEAEKEKKGQNEAFFRQNSSVFLFFVWHRCKMTTKC